MHSMDMYQGGMGMGMGMPMPGMGMQMGDMAPNMMHGLPFPGADCVQQGTTLGLMPLPKWSQLQLQICTVVFKLKVVQLTCLRMYFRKPCFE